jgi:transcriptional regulator with XRE-family HTH domain
VSSRTPPADGPPPAGSGAGPLVLRMSLGAQLRRHREAAGVTREDAAYVLRASPPKISRMELGRVRLKERDVLDLLTRYGVRDEGRRAHFVDLVRRSNAEGWWQAHRDLLPASAQTYLSMEHAACAIRVLELHHVPALLRTEEYAQAVLRLSHHGAAQVRRHVEVLRRRQERLHARNPPHLWAVLDESVLARRITEPAAHRAQLRRLAELAALPHVTVQVVPLDRAALPPTGGGFTLLRFPDPALSDVVHVEQLAGALTLDRPADVEAHLQAWNQACAAADPPRATPGFLVRHCPEQPHRRQHDPGPHPWARPDEGGTP